MLSPREAIEQNCDLSTTVPPRGTKDAVVEKWVPLVNEWEWVTHWRRGTVERAIGGRGRWHEQEMKGELAQHGH